VSRYNGYAHIFLNVLEKIILVEQFHGQYLVIELHSLNAEGVETDHVHSIVVKVGDSRAQFNEEGMNENLKSIRQLEPKKLFRTKYTLWTSVDVETLNRRLNQILLTFGRYVFQLAAGATLEFHPLARQWT
jgi:hypothetical protein